MKNLGINRTVSQAATQVEGTLDPIPFPISKLRVNRARASYLIMVGARAGMGADGSQLHRWWRMGRGMTPAWIAGLGGTTANTKVGWRAVEHGGILVGSGVGSSRTVNDTTNIYIDSYEKDAARRCQLRAGWIRDEVVALEDGSWLVLADQLVAESVASDQPDVYYLDI